MAAEVADVPRGRRTAARDLGHDVDDGDERQLHAAERLRLVKTKQPGLVQQLLVLANEDARILGGLRALAQHRHDFARAAHRLVVADGGEIAARGLGQGADGAWVMPQRCLGGQASLQRGTRRIGWNDAGLVV